MKPLALLLVAAMLVPPAMGTSWAQENADPANQGRLDRTGPTSLTEASFTALDGRVITQIVEGPAGLALAGTLGGTVYALDASGDEVWQADVGDEIRTAPLWTGEHVVVLPRGGTAYAFTATGEEAWTLPVDNRRGATVVRMASPIEHPSGDVVLATMAGNVHRVTPDGSIAWSAEIGGQEAIEATPAITSDGDVVAAAFEPGRDEHGLLARLDGATGEEVWQRTIGAQVVGAPTVLADTVLVPLRDGNALQARSLSDGNLRWEEAFDASITASPSLHEGLAIVGDIRGNLRALEVSGGQEAWSFHPFGDDPAVNPVQSVTYTIADSVAVDDRGVAWVPYWVADLSASSCCPPEDSTDSPFYRLDAADGELLDRRSDPKANHGPGLLATGVWTGSDEGGVRHVSTGPSLQIHAEGGTNEAQLVVNTLRSGDWQIAWDDQITDEGQGSPPTIATQELDPGRHTVTVSVDEATARQTVLVDGSEADEEPEDDTTTPSDEDQATDSEDDGTDREGSSSGEEPEPEPEPIPLAPLAALLAVAVAAGVRSRA